MASSTHQQGRPRLFRNARLATLAAGRAVDHR